MQSKLDVLKAQIDADENVIAEKVVKRMNEIRSSISNSLTTLQKENNNWFINLESSMKQAVKEAVDEYIV